MAEYNPCEWIIIGISGATCAGKTSLANKLSEELAPVIVFHQDHYFYPDDSPHHVRCDSLDHNNYDILSALDMLGLRRDMLRALAGRGPAGRGQGPAGRGQGPAGRGQGPAGRGQGPAGRGQGPAGRVPRLMVVEGFCVLNYKPIADMCNLKYYLTLEEAECRARRALRRYEPADVPGYFERCVWPGHLKYRREMQRDSSVRFLSGADPDVLRIVLQDIARPAAAATQSAGRCEAPCVTVEPPKDPGQDNAHNAHDNADNADNAQAGNSRDHRMKPPGCAEETCLQDKHCGKQA